MGDHHEPPDVTGIEILSSWVILPHTAPPHKNSTHAGTNPMKSCLEELQGSIFPEDPQQRPLQTRVVVGKPPQKSR